jgi:hypothetical protein
MKSDILYLKQVAFAVRLLRTEGLVGQAAACHFLPTLEV